MPNVAPLNLILYNSCHAECGKLKEMLRVDPELKLNSPSFQGTMDLERKLQDNLLVHQ